MAEAFKRHGVDVIQMKDGYLAETGDAGGFGAVVCEGVLASDVLGYLGGDFIYLV